MALCERAHSAARHIACALLVTFAPPAYGFDLTWSAPKGCPDSATVERLIAEIAGVSPGSQPKLRIAATQIADGRWQAELSGTSSRVVQGESCQSVAEAAALIAALWLTPEPPPRPRYFIAASASGGGGAGITPNASFVAGGSLTFGGEHFFGEVSVHHSFATRSDGAAAAELSLTSAAGRACYRALSFAHVCAGAEIGSIAATGVGIAAPLGQAVAHYAVFVSSRFSYRFSDRLRIFADPELVIPLDPVRFTIDDQAVFGQAPIGGRLKIGIEVTITSWIGLLPATQR